MKHIKMRKEDANKWLKALRSGDYKQGNGHLKTADNKFCCLGVLQHQKHNIKFVPSVVHNETQHNKLEQDPYLSKLGLLASAVNDRMVPLTVSFDGHEHLYNFNMIADAVEAELEYTD